MSYSVGAVEEENDVTRFATGQERAADEHDGAIGSHF